MQTTNDDLPWWNVHAEAVGDEQYDESLLEDLLDNLLEHDGVVTGTPEEPIDGRARYGAGFSVQASDAVEAVGRARRAVGRLTSASVDGDRPAGLPGARGPAQGHPGVDGGQRAQVPRSMAAKGRSPVGEHATAGRLRLRQAARPSCSGGGGAALRSW